MIDRKLTLSDGIITLRPSNLEDAQSVYEAVIESLAELKPWMTWAYDGYSIDDAIEWIKDTNQSWKDGEIYNFIITDTNNGAILGTSGMVVNSKLYRFGNLGYWVRTRARGRGIAGHAAKLVARFSFEKLAMLRAEIVVAETNYASLRVAEKIGAKREGLLRNRIKVGEIVYNAWMHSLIPQDFGL